MGSANVAVDHYVSWHTGDGVAHDLRGELTPGIHGLIHDTIVLTIGTLGSGATLCLPKVNDRLHRVLGVDLNLVEDGVGHWVSPLDYLSIILPPASGSGRIVPLHQLAHHTCQSGTSHITFLLPPVP